MGRFVEGEDRRQSFLLPELLDDYVTEDNPVRVVEAFIDELELGALGFEGVQPASTGRPAYHPSTLLKIYLYGYLNRVQSALDRADRDESDVAEARTTRIKDKIARLRQQMQALQAMKEKVQDARAGQLPANRHAPDRRCS